jgi:hypothetical protein
MGKLRLVISIYSRTWDPYGDLGTTSWLEKSERQF